MFKEYNIDNFTTVVSKLIICTVLLFVLSTTHSFAQYQSYFTSGVNLTGLSLKPIQSGNSGRLGSNSTNYPHVSSQLGLSIGLLNQWQLKTNTSLSIQITGLYEQFKIEDIQNTSVVNFKLIRQSNERIYSKNFAFTINGLYTFM